MTDKKDDIETQVDRALAEIVGTSNTPAILDTSQMKVSERTRFFTDFADGICLAINSHPWRKP